MNFIEGWRADVTGSCWPLLATGAFPLPQPGEVLREGQGVIPQSAPTRSPNEIFVEYNGPYLTLPYLWGGSIAPSAEAT